MKDRLCNKCLNNNNGWCKALKTNKGLREITECAKFESCEGDKTTLDDLMAKLESMQNLIDEMQDIVTLLSKRG